MKRIIAIFLCLAFVFSLAACSGNTPDDQPNDDEDTRAPAGKTFYVSPDGNDANDGSENSPLATATGARDAIRKYKAENGLPDGGIEAVFKAGTYKITSSVELLPEDSGEEGKPIVYRAEDGAEVVFDGGVTLNGSDFASASDEIKKRIPDENARKNLLEIDLAVAGCFDLESRTDYGTGWGSDSYRQELYVDNKRQVLAQWPNDGAYETKGRYNDDEGKMQLRIPEDKYELWNDVEGIAYYGAPQYDWDMRRAFSGAVSVNDEEKTLDIDKSVLSYCDPSKKSTFWVYNLPEEIDIPGEYWWDVQTNKLYYYPDGDLTDKKIVFSQYKDSFIVLNGTKYLGFDGITFENARTAVISGNNAENSYVNVENCVFRCIGVNALHFTCTKAFISSNEFYQLGSGGVSLSGGNLTTLECSDSVITNNKIYDYGQTYMVYQAGIDVTGLGFTISHHEIFNSPHFAIAHDSGETLIEYNDIHDVCKCTSDSGAVYIGRRWDWGANVVRYNYIHDISDVVHGGSPNGIYLDDMVSDQHIYGNLIVNVAGVGIVTCSGKFNQVENNVIVNSGGSAISNDERGFGFAAETVVYPTGYMWSTLLKTDPYSKFMVYARPQNLLTLELAESLLYYADSPAVGSYTVVRGNVSYGESESWGETRHTELHGTTEANAYYPLGTDVGFVDEENGNYFILDDSRIYRDIPGFEKIPFDKIGIIK